MQGCSLGTSTLIWTTTQTPLQYQYSNSKLKLNQIASVLHAMTFYPPKFVAMPLPPVIFITDHTTLPPTANRYICGNNDIVFPTAYKQIKSLLSHPTCPHRRRPDTWPCHPCESTFTTKYWSCAATLLDYFADFYPTDTPLMQSIWFYLLDIWQENASHLPYEAVLE